MAEDNINSMVRTIPTRFATTMDPPLTRSALKALLEKRQDQYYEDCASALQANSHMPDRKEYELDRISRLLNTLK